MNKNKNTRLKKQKKQRHIFKKLITVIVVIMIFLIVSFLGFCVFIYFNAPEFNTDLLYKQESSNIYDSKGDLIATIGMEKRQIVEYKELPQILIDAIIATEDSRFFDHHGFDLPRFLKASYGYFSGSNAGGASTLTMQVSKNTFTSTEAEGIEGIVRKFTDIYLSIFKKTIQKKKYLNSMLMNPT